MAQKAGHDNTETVKHFFLEKTEQIPSNWKAAYEAAKHHEDVQKMLIEKIKLDTIHEIRDKFINCWEKTQ